jgi:RecA DNA recombination protein
MAIRPRPSNLTGLTIPSDFVRFTTHRTPVLANGDGERLIFRDDEVYTGARGEQKAKMPRVARAELESLLQRRKLDGTLTTANIWHDVAEDRLAATGWTALDAALGGGFRRGHLSEIVGGRSSGRTAIALASFAAATARGEVVALVDTHDRFDPAAAAAAGVDLSRVLWIRDRGDALRALKAMNLVLHAGGFGVVALDLADVRGPELRQFPMTTWMRLSRVIEGSQTVALLIGAERLARSPGGVTIALDRQEAAASIQWSGQGDRARLLRGIHITPRVVAAHRYAARA